MLDDKGGQNFFDQIHKLWIIPEIERREKEGRLPEKLGIRYCLIKLPTGQQPIVEFNDEVHWLATVKKREGIAFAEGDPVYLHQIESVATVERPMVDGKPVAFVYIYVTAEGWKVIFDFSPNLPDDYVKLPESDDWTLGKSIAESINDEMTGRIVGMHDALQKEIQGIGLWPAPALLMFPLSKIAELCSQGKFDEARQVLVDHCTPEFLAARVNAWNDVPAFTDRKQKFQDALDAHRTGKYTLSIPALVPQIEGVITDWIITKLPAGTVKEHQKDKTQQLKDVLTAGVDHSIVERRVIEAALGFILEGPMLAQFRNWNLTPGPFANRHAVGHGKYDPSIETAENSIKAFLMLDTLHHVMAGHDAG